MYRLGEIQDTGKYGRLTTLSLGSASLAYESCPRAGGFFRQPFSRKGSGCQSWRGTSFAPQVLLISWGVNILATALGQHSDRLGFAGPIGDPNPKQQPTGCYVLLEGFGMMHADRVGGKTT
jgi:hypothetical protein